jgi:hypothetical protein
MGYTNTKQELYSNDHNYQQAAKDYAEMGPLWAEMVFPDDFEAMKALYGHRYSQSSNNDQYNCREERRRDR